MGAVVVVVVVVVAAAASGSGVVRFRAGQGPQGFSGGLLADALLLSLSISNHTLHWHGQARGPQATRSPKMFSCQSTPRAGDPNGQGGGGGGGRGGWNEAPALPFRTPPAAP